MSTLNLALGDAEIALRADVVAVYGTTTGGFWPDTPERGSFPSSYRLARMVITDQRVVFLPPEVPAHYVITAWLRAAFAGVATHPPPLRRTRSFELTALTRLHSWQPPFSGPPMFETSHGCVYFMLRVDGYPWRRPADKQAMREHFEVLERAWIAARTS